MIKKKFIVKMFIYISMNDVCFALGYSNIYSTFIILIIIQYCCVPSMSSHVVTNYIYSDRAKKV